jgi:hypothetical protein
MLNEAPRSKLTGYQKRLRDRISELSPPSVLIGGPVRTSPWIPAKGMRE